MLTAMAPEVVLDLEGGLFALSYIQNPLLLKGKKFDVRSYLLIACTAPYTVFFRHGYVRLTCDLYDPNSKSLSAHLTNQVDPYSGYTLREYEGLTGRSKSKSRTAVLQ